MLAEFTRNIFVLNVTKKDLHHLLSRPPQFFSDTPAAKKFLCKERTFSSSFDLSWRIRKGKPTLPCPPDIRISPSILLLFYQATLTKFLDIVPASNQCAGAWNIHFYSEEFFIRFKSSGTLKGNSSTPFGAARLFLFCSSSARSLCSSRTHKIQWRHKEQMIELAERIRWLCSWLKECRPGFKHSSSPALGEKKFLWVLSHQERLSYGASLWTERCFYSPRGYVLLKSSVTQ